MEGCAPSRPVFVLGDTEGEDYADDSDNWELRVEEKQAAELQRQIRPCPIRAIRG
jgi:hypothetical protein